MLLQLKTLLHVLLHKSVNVDGLLDGDSVSVLEQVLVFVLNSVQLEAQDFGHFHQPLSLESVAWVVLQLGACLS
jgi:hypothetical protein